MTAIVGRLEDEEQRIHKLAIERLWAVLRIQVVGINGGFLARGLNDGSRAKGLTVSEVILQSHAAPTVHLDGDKAGIVIAMSETRTHGDIARHLPGGVHHAEGKVESGGSAALVQV